MNRYVDRLIVETLGLKLGIWITFLLKRDMLLIGSLTGAVVFNIVSKYIQNFQKILKCNKLPPGYTGRLSRIYLNILTRLSRAAFII